MPIRRPEAEASIAVFAVLNFVLAGLALLWALLIGAVLIFGILLSGDQADDLAEGVLGCLVLGVPSLFAMVVYLLAGVGLVRRRAWGYHFHLGGAVLAAFTCLGVVYTILAFVFATKPEFYGAFFAQQQRPRRDRWEEEDDDWEPPSRNRHDHRIR
jgi:hypothetical protein